MSEDEKSREKKRLLKRWIFTGAFTLIGACFLIKTIAPKQRVRTSFPQEEAQIETASTGLDPSLSRIGDLELTQEQIEERIEVLFSGQKEIKEQLKGMEEVSERSLSKMEDLLEEKLEQLSTERKDTAAAEKSTPAESREVEIVSIEAEEPQNRKHVSRTIPPLTVVRCVVVSGVAASTGLGAPVDCQKVLLRPLENGWLPSGVRVNLKNAMIGCGAEANYASRRIFIRGERMTLTFANGDFIETEISAYVSGEDGLGGVKGRVINEQWKQDTLAVLFSGLDTFGRALQSSSSPLDFSKIGKSENKFIINLDTFRQSGLQASSTAWDKIVDSLIKEKERRSPILVLEQGREVDLVFLYSCDLGEENLQEKLRIKRALAKKGGKNHA